MTPGAALPDVVDWLGVDIEQFLYYTEKGRMIRAIRPGPLLRDIGFSAAQIRSFGQGLYDATRAELWRLGWKREYVHDHNHGTSANVLTYTRPPDQSGPKPELGTLLTQMVREHLRSRRSSIPTIAELLKELGAPSDTRSTAIAEREVRALGWSPRRYCFKHGVVIDVYEPPQRRCPGAIPVQHFVDAPRRRTTREANEDHGLPVKARRRRKGNDGRGLAMR